MRMRLIVCVLVLTYLATFALVGPGAARTGDPWDWVWDVMNRDPVDMGCVGCHIGPEPASVSWFGPDQETVLQTLETGITPDGRELSVIPVEGGRKGRIGTFLREAIMPLGGPPWGEKEIAILDEWLILYE